MSLDYVPDAVQAILSSVQDASELQVKLHVRVTLANVRLDL